MPQNAPKFDVNEVVQFTDKYGRKAAVEHFGFSERTLRYYLHKYPAREKPPEFIIPQLPDPELPYEELRAQRMQLFERKHAYDRAKHWIPVTMRDSKPMALVFMGDPHVDDDGCNWPLLDAHTQIIRRTPGMYAGNLGDTQNNWIGRLSRLYANQSTSHSQAWRLAEGWLNELKSKLLFMVRGNHDSWAGNSDPLDWIMRGFGVVDQDWQAKFKLVWPNGDELPIWVAHDFKGHSQYNNLHGNKKAHLWHRGAEIFGSGHRHDWGLQQFEDSDAGKIIHLVRARGYKFIDSYGEHLGYTPEQYGASMTAVIVPGAAKDKRVTWFLDVEAAADYLTYRRGKK